MWSQVTGQPERDLIVVLTEVDPANSIEAGEIVPEPGDEQQWLGNAGIKAKSITGCSDSPRNAGLATPWFVFGSVRDTTLPTPPQGRTTTTTPSLAIRISLSDTRQSNWARFFSKTLLPRLD
jgi:hypothetical protein